MTDLLLATRNRHKVREIREILAGLPYRVLSLDDVGEMPEVLEDGATFQDNAVKKAMTIARTSGMISMADDSGLVVDSLHGQPGVYSARFAGEGASDQENNRLLLDRMAGFDGPQRSARFVCCIAICTPDGECQTAEDCCEGRIAWQASGSGGFGYDPLFIPQGWDISFAEMNPEEKHSISHRGRALAKARGLLAVYAGNSDVTGAVNMES